MEIVLCVPKTIILKILTEKLWSTKAEFKVCTTSIEVQQKLHRIDYSKNITLKTLEMTTL